MRCYRMSQVSLRCAVVFVSLLVFAGAAQAQIVATPSSLGFYGQVGATFAVQSSTITASSPANWNVGTPFYGAPPASFAGTQNWLTYSCPQTSMIGSSES